MMVNGVREGNFWAHQPLSKCRVGTTTSTFLPSQRHQGHRHRVEEALGSGNSGCPAD